MNIKRVLAPALIALLLVIILGAIFFLQIQNSIALIEQATVSVSQKTESVLKPILAPVMNIPSLENDTEALSALREGELFMLQGNLAEAEQAFESSARLGGGIPALRKLISVQLQRRNFSDARKSINDLEDEGVSDADIAYLRGLLELRQGKIDDARTYFNGVQSLPQGQYGLALIAIATGNHDTAQESLTLVAQGADPILRTSARTLLSAYDEFSLFEDGSDIHLVTLVARALAQVQECEIALPLLNQVVSREDDYRDAWIVKGFCELSTERFTESLASLEQAYNIDPEKPETQYFLARAHFMLGDPQNAVTFLQYAVLNGFQPEKDARNLLATYAVALGDTTMALEQYRALAENPSADLTPFTQFIDLALTIPDQAESGYELAKIAVSRWPEEPRALLLLARSEIATNRLVQAEENLEQIIRLDPTNGEARQLKEELNQPQN